MSLHELIRIAVALIGTSALVMVRVFALEIADIRRAMQEGDLDDGDEFGFWICVTAVAVMLAVAAVCFRAVLRP